MELEYQNDLRHVNDLFLNSEQRNFLVDAEAAKIYQPAFTYDWATLDRSRWNQTYDLGTIDAHVQWYKTWLAQRRTYLYANVLDNTKIPSRPVVTLIGSTALDDMFFSNSHYADPNLTAFSALEWHIGEWSDPNLSLIHI